jgi:hypothetical protein
MYHAGWCKINGGGMEWPHIDPVSSVQEAYSGAYNRHRRLKEKR